MESNYSNDQASELRKMVTDDEQPNKHSTEEEKTEETTTRKIDLLNLPPRKEVHTKKKAAKIRIGSPLIRLIIVFLVLVGVSLYAYYLWNN